MCEGSSSLPWAALGEEDSWDMIEDRRAQQRLQEVYLAKSLTAQVGGKQTLLMDL